MRCSLILGMLALWISPVQAQHSVPACPPLSLYCINLIPTETYYGAIAHVELARPESAFGVVVSRDGLQRYQLVLDVAGLPDLPEPQEYVLWVMPLDLDPVIRLGSIGNGHFDMGEVAFNKFMLLVSLESERGNMERKGSLVLRGRSPSSRLEPHDMFQVSAFVDPGAAMEEGHHDHGSTAWPPPAMHPAITMMDAMMTLSPDTDPWLPEHSDAPLAMPRQVMRLADGDSITLHAHPVKKVINGRSFSMLGYNGQIPGPLLDVDRNTTITVTFRNDAPFASSIHWHGLRQDNAFDGVPGITQDPVLPGESFTYKVHFPDAGMYWYHPHHREEAQQDLGLYGNMIVRAPDYTYLAPASREEILVLDDFTIGPQGNVPYGKDAPNFILMGRFGNQLLVNGEVEVHLRATQGDTLRWFVTNVSNTRTWNLSLDGHVMNVLASDQSPFEIESWEESMAIAPAERYIADFYLEQAGTFAMVNRIQSLDHTTGVFFAEVDTVGWLTVEPSAFETPPIRTTKGDVTANIRPDIREEISTFSAYEHTEPDKEVDLLIRTENLPPLVDWILKVDQTWFPPVEWSGTMPMMNWSSTTNKVDWLIREPSTGRENMEIDWTFALDSVEKIRIHNRRDAQHAMQHPVHLHGQRFLVLSYNGRPTTNRVWKDTVLIPAGMTADLLVEFTNPGKWMMHCHIAEHLEAGMKLAFLVE